MINVSRNKTKHLFYWILPLLINIALTLLYFKGGFRIRETIDSSLYREFSLLEMVQNILILLIISLSIIATVRKTKRPEKLVFIFIAIVSVFVFLEEIDYGMNFYDFFKGLPIPEDAHGSFRNLHDIPGLTDTLKTIFIVAAFLGFIIIPLVLGIVNNDLFRYLRPDKFVSYGAAACFAFLILDYYLINHLPGVDIFPEANFHSEMTELNLYYVSLLYVINIYRNKYGAT